jgi:hypothetical protein
MKKIVRLTESDLTNIVKRVIKERYSEDEDFDLDEPFITYRQIVQSILSDISVDVANELGLEEYDGHGEIPEYLKQYFNEVLKYVKDDEMSMKLWDGINDSIMYTSIHDKIVDSILSNN